MSVILNDKDIEKLIKETKPLPDDYRARLVTKPKRGHKERELDFKGAGNSDFRLILRQNILNPLDFSVILAFLIPKKNQLFRLRRYNGKSHEHSNILEGERFYSFHIHQATERYQNETGLREDSFAQPTDRYGDFSNAMKCMFKDCAFQLPSDPQAALFEEE